MKFQLRHYHVLNTFEKANELSYQPRLSRRSVLLRPTVRNFGAKPHHGLAVRLAKRRSGGRVQIAERRPCRVAA